MAFIHFHMPEGSKSYLTKKQQKLLFGFARIGMHKAGKAHNLLRHEAR